MTMRKVRLGEWRLVEASGVRWLWIFSTRIFDFPVDELTKSVSGESKGQSRTETREVLRFGVCEYKGGRG